MTSRIDFAIHRCSQDDIYLCKSCSLPGVTNSLSLADDEEAKLKRHSISISPRDKKEAGIDGIEFWQTDLKDSTASGFMNTSQNTVTAPPQPNKHGKWHYVHLVLRFTLIASIYHHVIKQDSKY